MFTTYYVSCVRCHLLCVTCHMSHIRCHMTHVLCHMSHFFVSSNFYKYIFSWQIGGAIWCMVCYQLSLLTFILDLSEVLVVLEHLHRSWEHVPFKSSTSTCHSSHPCLTKCTLKKICNFIILEFIGTFRNMLKHIIKI